MLTIKCVKNGIPTEYILYQYIGKEETPEDVKETANTLWKNLLNNPSVKDLMGLLPNGDVQLPPNSKPKTWGVWGKYSDGPKAKLYPFECDHELKENDKFISTPNGIPAITTVVACRWVERERVLAACEGHKLYKIKYVLKAV